MKRLSLLFFSIVCSIIINAQNTHHVGLFPTIDHSGTLTRHLDYGIYYFGGSNLFNPITEIGESKGANFFVFYAEQSLTYKVTPKLSFTGSYVYERQHPAESNYRNEHRFYVQSAYKYNLKRTQLKHRIRFDGRFIENRLTNKISFSSRLRYQFAIKVPLKKKDDKLYFSAYNEFFFNLDKKTPAIYGENWAYAGVGYNFGKAGSLEAGPLYIFWVTNKQNDISNFYYLQLSWITYIDFTKKNTKANP